MRFISALFRGGVALVIVAISLGVVAWLNATRHIVTPSGHDHANTLIVEAVALRAVPVARTFPAYGTVRAIDEADLAAEVVGRVIERPVRIEEGAPVRYGEVIVRIDPGDYEARIDELETQIARQQAELARLEVSEASLASQAEFKAGEVKSARDDYTRVENLFDQGVSTQAELDASLERLNRSERELTGINEQRNLIPVQREIVRADIARIRAQMDLAQRDLDRTTITAPFDGVLQRVMVRQGELVSPGTPVARVVDTSRLEVPLRVSASAARLIDVGDRVRVQTEGTIPVTEDDARVIRVAPEADPLTRTVAVFVELRQQTNNDRRGARIRPGDFVNAEVIAGDVRPELIVPRRAIMKDRVFVAKPIEPGELPSSDDPDAPPLPPGLMRVESIAVHVKYFTAGTYADVAPEERQWAVLDEGPLGAGDRVLVSNLEQLSRGMLVDVRSITDRATADATAWGRSPGS